MNSIRYTPDQVVAEIHDLFTKYGAETYGEGVTQLEHAIQVGLLAQASGAEDELIVAAFLHDIGHICAQEAESMGSYGRHDHDANGGAWARERGFPENVARLIENHVAAKRYLTATDATYAKQLSHASQVTLAHQGGPMSPSEVAVFEQDELFHLHIRMRLWDEAGKDDSADLQNIAPFLGIIRHFLTSTSQS